MPKQLVYRGPAASFDTGGRFSKPYVFVKDGPSIAVNNEDAEDLLTYPQHFFFEAEAEGEAQPALRVPVGASIGDVPPQET